MEIQSSEASGTRETNLGHYILMNKYKVCRDDREKQEHRTDKLLGNHLDRLAETHNHRYWL